MTVTSTLSDTKFVEEVREALAGFDENKIPDSTVIHQRDRQVIPYLEDKGITGSSVKIDNALIALTAEYSVKSWLRKRQMTVGDLQVTINVEQWIDDLESASSRALGRLDIIYQPSQGAAPFVHSSSGFYDDS